MKYTGNKTIPVVYSLRTLPSLSTTAITSACMNDDQSIIYACLTGVGIRIYSGGSWTSAVTGADTSAWQDIVCNSTGQYVVAIVRVGSTGFNIWYSSNYGANFTQSASSVGSNLGTVAMSSNGQYVYTVSDTTAGMFYWSSNYGVTWTNVSTNTTPSRVGCDTTGQYVLIYHSTGTSPNNSLRYSKDYGLTFTTIGGANAGALGPPRIYFKTGSPAWYLFTSAASSWNALASQVLNTTTNVITSLNTNPAVTSVSGFKLIDTSTSGKRLLVVETIATGNVYLCSDGYVNAGTSPYTNTFVNLSSTLGIPQASWKRVKSNGNESFVFASGANIYVYEWAYAA